MDEGVEVLAAFLHQLPRDVPDEAAQGDVRQVGVGELILRLEEQEQQLGPLQCWLLQELLKELLKYLGKNCVLVFFPIFILM